MLDFEKEMLEALDAEHTAQQREITDVDAAAIDEAQLEPTPPGYNKKPDHWVSPLKDPKNRGRGGKGPLKKRGPRKGFGLLKQEQILKVTRRSHSALIRSTPDIVEKLIEMALEGDINAIKMVLARTLPAIDRRGVRNIPSNSPSIEIHIGEGNGKARRTFDGGEDQHDDRITEGEIGSEESSPDEQPVLRGPQGPFNGQDAAAVDETKG